MANTLQRAYDAVNRGSDRGMQRASQLQQLFAQKDQMERQKKQDEYAMLQNKVGMATDLLSSKMPIARQQGAEMLFNLTSKNTDFMDGVLDLRKAVSSDEPNEQLEKDIQELADIKAEWAKPNHGIYKEGGKDAFRDALDRMSTNLGKHDGSRADRKRKQLDMNIATIDNQIKAAQEQEYELAKIKAKKVEKIEAEKAGTNWMLSDKSTVTSFDGGRTFKNATGQTLPMPYDAVKYNATVSGSEMSMIKAKSQAEGENTKSGELPAISSEEMVQKAKSGTGPYATMKATIDHLLGGFGVDALFGKDGFFQETQESRQVLNTVKQIGKSALMNSSRGAIWEQQRIDDLFPDPNKFFVNPTTEAKKFVALRGILKQEKKFNNKAIPSAVSATEVAKLRNSNTEIDRLLTLIGTNENVSSGSVNITDKQKSILELYPPKGN